MQLRVMWEEIMKRFKHIEVVADPVRASSTVFHAIQSLPVRIAA
jgi:cytochrome P450